MTEAGMEVSAEEAYNVAFARLCGLEKGLLSLTDEAREQAFDVGLATSGL